MPSSTQQTLAPGPSGKPTAQSLQDSQSVHSATFASVPSLASLGPIFKSSNPIELTESETEYVVSCIKHVLPEHVVFQVSFSPTFRAYHPSISNACQFTCTNTLNDSILEHIVVEMKMEAEEDEPALVPEFSIPIDLLTFDAPQNAYVVFRRPQGACPTGRVYCLHFLKNN